MNIELYVFSASSEIAMCFPFLICYYGQLKIDSLTSKYPWFSENKPNLFKIWYPFHHILLDLVCQISASMFMNEIGLSFAFLKLSLLGSSAKVIEAS